MLISVIEDVSLIKITHDLVYIFSKCNTVTLKICSCQRIDSLTVLITKN
uniref:Uncharacterized protein n=1 Tax=Rhizophora mucronata TaxID=61149 RepID=A0A2P2N7I2_RHIMU